MSALASPSAFADQPDTPSTALARPKDAPASGNAHDRRDAFRIGVLGGVGFPRPLEVEAMVKLANVVALGAEGSFLPDVTVSGVAVSAWSAAGDARVFPFHGAFFLGLRGGYQRILASTTIAVPALGSMPESAGLDSWYVNPRVGFLWTLKSGFSIGIEAGVQIPVTTSLATTLPGAMAVQLQQSTVFHTVSGVLPTVDLLRIGALL